MTDFAQKHYDEIHQLIVQGSIRDARKLLSERGTDSVPREGLAQFSELLRRVNDCQRAVQILHPYVRGTSRRPADATPVEIAEYAVSLNRLGSQREALALMESIRDSAFPGYDLYLSFLLSTHWNNKERAAALTRFLRRKSGSPYERLVAKVNLVDALLYNGQNVKAHPLLSELLHDTSVRRLKLLHGNALQVAGMECVLKNDSPRAEQFFVHAEKVLKGTDLWDYLFVEKWRAIGELRASKEKGRKAISRVRELAEKEKHWETVRDCDRLMAVHFSDEKLFLHVFAGTPHECFRERLLKDYKKEVQLPENYLWNLKGKEAPEMTLSFAGRTLCKGAGRVPKLLVQTLFAFCQDFYRPLPIAGLSHRVYPQENFHPEYSPAKVHQVLIRLRKWLDDHEVPISIDHSPAGYSLHAKEPVSFELPLGNSDEIKDSELMTLKRAFGTEPFTAAQSSQLLNVTPRSVRRYLQEGLESKAVEKEGSGSATRYRFVS